VTYLVCIPCAGTGSRLGAITQFLNKSLVSIANRPTLSHIIEQYPNDARFVIALGYKGELVREFLSLAYPKRQFTYVEVEPFEGPGSGLGLSLLACKDFLQKPFIFNSCDTLVEGVIPPPTENWMAYDEVAKLSQYRTLRVTNQIVKEICEKGQGQTYEHKAYIGLAGIYEVEKFWSSMIEGNLDAIEQGESYGLRTLLPNIKSHRFIWHDTGNPQSLNDARNIYRKANEPNILEKSNEAIWFVDDQVIKFSDDESFIANRVKRVGFLDNFVPSVNDSTIHMYRYCRVDGNILSEVISLPLFKKLLEHCLFFWKKSILSSKETAKFKSDCLKFYKNKTYERIELFYKNFDQQDSMQLINDQETSLLNEMLEAIDWDWLSNGMPGRFHGDFHFENILWNYEKKQFIFLDWRQDFGGDLNTGDIYYDFAKLLHGLIISHELITKNFYEVNWTRDSINFDFYRKQILVECEHFFNSWILDQGYDLKKVRILTALIYLNIAALHHHPYSLLLFALGKSMLRTELEKA